MIIRVRVADPAGNITIFVLDPFDRKDYAKIAGELLKIKEFQAEQVGFLEKKQDGSLRMQMMGGEFCGNATRSFGYLRSMFAGRSGSMPVEVSGSEKVLIAETDLEQGTSRVQMPLPLGIRELQVKREQKIEVYPMVVFDGICHVIIKSKPGTTKFVETVIQEAEKEVPCGAYGVMFLEGSRMTPAVYVKETESLIWESSCGSGSMGAAVELSAEKGDGTYRYQLEQPGGVIEALVQKEGGKVIECKMGGKVSISEEILAEIPWKG